MPPRPLRLAQPERSLPVFQVAELSARWRYTTGRHGLGKCLIDNTPNSPKMERMEILPRIIEARLRQALERQKSVLLLGPRQTGKTTLLEPLQPDLLLNFLQPEVRQRYERAPQLLGSELEALGERFRGRKPLVALDEVQRVPELVNVVQDLIDRRLARFVLTGSSARKLRRGAGVNLLPGRLVPLRLDPLSLAERVPPSLEEALVYGSLPGIALAADDAARDEDLRAYTTLYLEEEVRAEALVRNLGRFSRFLQLAALEAGSISHFRGIAQELGVAHTTVAGYYEILEDCLIAERIEPLSESRTRKKLTKSPRYLFFDLGVRRAAAEEGPRLPTRVLGSLFEQFVGLELLRATRQTSGNLRLRFWRDPDGPEVDWILVGEDRWLSMEVKWSEAPVERDTRHLQTFLSEYPQAREGIVVCRTPRRLKIGPKITAVPWQEIPDLVAGLA
jgi:predicted AAA+ superfamily ATPase